MDESDRAVPRAGGWGCLADRPPMSAPDASLAARLTAGIRAGHRFDADFSYDPERCRCEECLRSDAIMADLLRPETLEATVRLLAQAREYHAQLRVTFDAACRRRTAEEGEGAREICGRLADELGGTLADQVRRMVVRDYGDHHGACSWCAAGDGWFAQISHRQDNE